MSLSLLESLIDFPCLDASNEEDEKSVLPDNNFFLLFQSYSRIINQTPFNSIKLYTKYMGRRNRSANYNHSVLRAVKPEDKEKESEIESHS